MKPDEAAKSRIEKHFTGEAKDQSDLKRGREDFAV
jgi:hypothetical protein